MFLVEVIRSCFRSQGMKAQVKKKENFQLLSLYEFKKDSTAANAAIIICDAKGKLYCPKESPEMLSSF